MKPESDDSSRRQDSYSQYTSTETAKALDRPHRQPFLWPLRRLDSFYKDVAEIKDRAADFLKRPGGWKKWRDFMTLAAETQLKMIEFIAAGSSGEHRRYVARVDRIRQELGAATRLQKVMVEYVVVARLFYDAQEMTIFGPTETDDEVALSVAESIRLKVAEYYIDGAENLLAAARQRPSYQEWRRLK